MPKKVLLVEDDLFTSRIVKSYFERKGYVVQQAYDAGSGLRSVVAFPPDCIILDINLPSESGLNIFNKFKKLHSCPIIFYTSIKKASVELQALELGCDDFVSKDRGLSILYHRVDRFLKDNAQVDSTSIVKINGFEINPNLNECSFEGNHLSLRLQECQVLYYMLVNAGNVVSRNELSFVTKGYSHDGWSRSIDLMLSRLRKKLVSIGLPSKCIQTVRGKGYCFVWK